MFDWKEIIKNQKTFQGLNIGEMTEDSLIEEDDDCIKRLRKIYDELVRLREKYKASGNYEVLGEYGIVFNNSVGKRVAAFILTWGTPPSNDKVCKILKDFKEAKQNTIQSHPYGVIEKTFTVASQRGDGFRTAIIVNGNEPNDAIAVWVKLYPPNREALDFGMYKTILEAFNV